MNNTAYCWLELGERERAREAAVRAAALFEPLGRAFSLNAQATLGDALHALGKHVAAARRF